MHVENISVKVGRKINIGNDEIRNLEIGMKIALNQNENVENSFYSLKNSLEGQLDSWEHEIRMKISGGSYEELSNPPPLIPADVKLKNGNQSFSEPFPTKNNDTIQTSQQGSYICPECREPMKQKEGKEYFLCSKHWGYPNQLDKGIVKERKY